MGSGCYKFTQFDFLTQIDCKKKTKSIFTGLPKASKWPMEAVHKNSYHRTTQQTKLPVLPPKTLSCTLLQPRLLGSLLSRDEKWSGNFSTFPRKNGNGMKI
jgi:hypothetical protein